MLKIILGIPLFIVSLILSAFTIWFMSRHSPSFDGCYSFARCPGIFVGFLLNTPYLSNNGGMDLLFEFLEPYLQLYPAKFEYFAEYYYQSCCILDQAKLLSMYA